MINSFGVIFSFSKGVEVHPPVLKTFLGPLDLCIISVFLVDARGLIDTYPLSFCYTIAEKNWGLINVWCSVSSLAAAALLASVDRMVSER